ncbi:MAG: glycosyltransferase [Planctomycetes bacterium]|nr:glycosyltransferase [Planctomycetota bacterium]
MKFSVVVPSFNQASFLPACLDSILSQEGKDLEVEILVYDGGSTDGSKEILEHYAPRLAYWQSCPDGGQAAVLRQGFKRACGEILGWVNSDDLLFPGALARAVEYFTGQPEVSLAYGDAIWIDARGEVLRPKREIDFDWKIFAYGYCYLPQPAAFFRKSAYEACGGVDPSFQCCMDYDLWHRLRETGGVGHISAFMAGIRQHPEAKTSRLQANFRQEEARLREQYLHCSAAVYRVRHYWQRLRRIFIRLRQNCYRALSPEEMAQCNPIK